jgi:phage gp36-like protein
MAYSTVADVQIAAGGEKSLRELSDVDNSSAINVAAVEAAIIAADATIDSHLFSRVQVPLAAPVPAVIRTLSADEAVFILKSRRRAMVTDADLALHEARLQTLGALASGRTTLGVYPEPTKSELLRYDATDRPSDKAVSREALKGFC